MNLYEPIAQRSIIDRINQICNMTNQSYSNVEKIAAINDAIDRYWAIASGSAPQGTLDDLNNTSSPIETQNLVDGTNAYKLSDFSSNILQILKLTILNEDGNEEDLIYEDFDDVNEFLERYSTDTEDKSTPQYWTKIGDYLYIAPTPDYAKTDGLRIYANRELSKFTFTNFTITIATPGVITATAHGLSDGDAVILISDGSLPTGLTADSTVYYVSGKTADTFKLATTPSAVGSTEIETTGSQSGTHQFIKVNREPGIPVVHHKYLSRYAANDKMDVKHPNFGKNSQQIIQDEKEIQDYWERMIRPSKTILQTKSRRYR